MLDSYMFAAEPFELFPTPAFPGVAPRIFSTRTGPAFSAQPFYFQSIPHCSCTLFPQTLYSHALTNWVPGVYTPIFH
jgi:hypothetical protein